MRGIHFLRFIWSKHYCRVESYIWTYLFTSVFFYQGSNKRIYIFWWLIKTTQGWCFWYNQWYAIVIITFIWYGTCQNVDRKWFKQEIKTHRLLWFRSNPDEGMAMKFCLVNLLESIIIIKPICNHLCETMTKYKLFITFISSFFVLVWYKIWTLTFDHSNLQLLMLYNDKRKIIYDN